MIFLILILICSFIKAVEKNLRLDFTPKFFNESMSKGYKYNTIYSGTCPLWTIMRTLYTHNFVLSKKNYNNVRIPKKIHWIWLGSPLPPQFKKYQESWIKYHPDWEFKIWKDEDFEIFNLVNYQAYKKAKNWGEKSDICRYEILYRYGGLYIDTDFECLKPFDILHHICDFFVGISYEKELLLYNGLIGSIPGHPILKACIENLKGCGTNSTVDIMNNTGPQFFTKMFFLGLQKNRTIIIPFPITYFYPFPNNIRNFPLLNSSTQELVKKNICLESFSVHYWACSWDKN